LVGARPLADLVDERSVELQNINWEDGERSERAVPAAEIADGDAHPEPAKPLQSSNHGCAFVRHDALGDLQEEPVGGQASPSKAPGDLVHDAVVLKLAR